MLSLYQNFGGLCLRVLEPNQNFSTAYHLQIDGKIERVNQVVEGMLREYVMQQLSQWEEYFHLVEFA